MANVLLTAKDAQDRTLVKELRANGFGSLVTTDTLHTHVHQGELLATGHLATGVANAASIEVLLQTAVTHDAHMYIKTAAGGDSTFSVFEGVTITAAGTAAGTANHNRNYADTANLTSTHTPTISDYGTQIWAQFIPGGTGGSSPGAVSDVGVEQVVLKAGEDYVLRLTNNAGTAQTLNTICSFYEVAI